MTLNINYVEISEKHLGSASYLEWIHVFPQVNKSPIHCNRIIVVVMDLLKDCIKKQNICYRD